MALSKTADEVVDSPSVVKFYEGRSILITGATGFMGKVLVNLLTASPER
jgi:FlaA1/EpsC-like NDP-sugar epimerase